MKTSNRMFVARVAGAILAWTPLAAHAGEALSPERMDVLDRDGVFSPAFKKAVHELVTDQDAIKEARTEQQKAVSALPDLRTQASAAQAKVSALREELAKYDHPEEHDFHALQARMSDPAATPEEQMALAQAYVWAYATSPHEAEAEQYLEQVEKQKANQLQAEKDAEAARQAARAKLIERAQARQLSLGEWRSFLQDMSQDDLLKYLGKPTAQEDGYWIYSGSWLVDPTTNRKVGMEINLSGGRVLSVDEAPHAP
jgi:hypothetical protein